VTPLAPLELALGQVLGHNQPTAFDVRAAGAPLAALEAVIAGALLRPPCLISFSGGRDSSAVLAVAVALARREGLPDPIPATIRAPRAPWSDEAAWQELVVRHLGIRDWHRHEVGDELDVVGPVAQRILARHGLLWPFNAHFHSPLLEAARGGTLLTGIGGDELFGAATSRRAAAVLQGRVRPAARDARRVLLHAAPRTLRRWWHAQRSDAVAHPWLTPDGAAAARDSFAAGEAAEPRALAARMRHVRSARYLATGVRSLDLIAADAGATIAHPLLDPGVWAAVARQAPRGGYLARSDAMRDIFGDLLPDALHARRDKAGFDDVFFHDHSRVLARRWDERGVPTNLVDAAALRRHWLEGSPRAQSFTLLQAAWLASAAREGIQEQLPRGLQGIPPLRTPQPQNRK
jgi:asparagine synthase (glutamine-hydrolysing)